MSLPPRAAIVFMLGLTLAGAGCSGGDDDSGESGLYVVVGSVTYVFGSVECIETEVVGSEPDDASAGFERVDVRFDDSTGGGVWAVSEGGDEELLGSFEGPLLVDADTGERSTELEGGVGELLRFNCPG